MCRRALAAGTLLLVGLTASSASLAQAAPAPFLALSTSQAPTNLPPEGKGRLLVSATNLGDAPLGGEVIVTDRLPAGLTALAVSGSLANQISFPLECSLKSAQEVSCAYREPTPIAPLTGLKLEITVRVGGVVSGENHVEALGAVSATSEAPVHLSASSAPYGVEKYDFRPEEEGGAPDRRAGSHPFQLTTTLALNQTAKEEPVALTKNLQFSLPPGLIGNPDATAKCSQTDFNTETADSLNLCGPATVIGEAQVTIEEPVLGTIGPESRTIPIFNVEPAPGEPARFGLVILKDPIVLQTSVRTGSDYGVVVAAHSSSQIAGLLSSTATFWGVPGDPRHNADRGWACVSHGAYVGSYAECETQMKAEEKLERESRENGTYREPKPFLVLPTSCGTVLSAPAQVQSWMPGSSYQPPFESQTTESLEGCSLLDLNPVISVEPETHSASTPSGLTVDLKPPQEESSGPVGERLAESAIRSTEVTLPAGLQLSPAAAGGLLACSVLQVGFLGGEESAQTQNNNFSPESATCPDAAKVGTVAIKSPDLEHELTGSVYLGAEGSSPFEPPLVLYVVAQDPVSGVRVKLAGEVTPDPVTGQLTSTFEDTPQVPFEELKLKFFGGPRASQSTPPLCGAYTTSSSFRPWSGGAAAASSASFPITSGPGGTACPPSPLPFAPSFAAYSTNVQAGAFSPFSLKLGVPDGHQALTSLSASLPAGMAAMLSSITPCPVAVADVGQCGAGSLVGHSVTSSGLGSEPFSLPGTVYVTQGLDGAPFGLSVATPAVAGPFDLGVIVANSTIRVDPTTAAVTVTAVETRIVDNHGSNVLGSTPLPTIVKGVPVALNELHVTIDRPGFQFNPTSCTPSEIEATLGGAEGGSAAVASRFQVANCASLRFAPVLSASTGSTFSKVRGSSLIVKVTSTPEQANIAKTRLVIPALMPSRLTTIQKACTDKVFKANPAACPEGSNIGYGVAHTPVLKSALTGPAYLVSHGGAAFPDVEFVLQGEGIMLVLDGQTNIRHGVTTSTFNSLPDAPLSSFEAVLPAGPHSALTVYLPGHSNLCSTHIVIPTTITGHNGAVIEQRTKVAVTGCKGVKSFRQAHAPRLAKALEACRRLHRRSKRAVCERAARKRYAIHAKKRK